MDDYEDNNIKELVRKFENGFVSGELPFFDVVDIEEIAEYFFERNELEKVKVLVDYGMEQYPSDTDIQILKAQYLFYMGKFEKALSLLNEIELLNPKNSTVIITKARIYSIQNQHERAVKELEDILNYEDNSEVHYELANEYVFLKNIEKALFHLEKYILQNPDDELVFFEIGFQYFMEFKFDEAIDFFKKIIDRFPLSHFAWYQLASSYFSNNEYEKAIDAAEYAIAINKSYVLPYRLIGNIYEITEDYAKAIEIYNLATTNCRGSASDFYNSIGYCYEQLEKFQEAYDSYLLSISADNNNELSWAGAAYSLFNMASIEQSLHFINKAIKLNEGNPDFYRIKAEILNEQNSLEEAIECYRKSVDIDPSFDETWCDFSDLLFENYRVDAAMEIVEEGISYNKESSRLIYRKAAYLYLTGNKQESLHVLAFALAKDFEGHGEFLEYDERLGDSDEILELIVIMHPRYTKK